MGDEEFEDLLAKSDLLAKPSFNALSPRTSRNFQALGQEREEVRVDDTSVDNGLDFKADHDADLPCHNILSHLSLPDPVLTPLTLRSCNTSTEKENENTFPFGSLRTIPSPVRWTKAGVVSKIEAMMESLADGILEDRGSLAIPLRTRASKRKPNTTPHAGARVAHHIHQPTDVCFPGSTPKEAWRFTVLVRILELIHEALVEDSCTTKRDIYYKDPSLFGKQAVVDRYVDDLAYTFEVSRSALNVVAAAKGLVIGRFTIERSDGTTVKGDSEHEGMLVPNIHELDDIDISGVAWILVIEKEATFRALAAIRFYQNCRIGDGVLVTAKGYPDISTRAFLRCLSVSNGLGHQPPPVFALVDFDPDGIGILSNYKYGSLALAHENAELNVPETRWIGVQSKDLNADATVDECKGLLRLTARDRRKATLMLEKETFAEDGPEVGWRREMQVMLILDVKAEIQLLSEREGGLQWWLEGRLGESLEAERWN